MQATTCPSCGAPQFAARQKPPTQIRPVFRILLFLIAGILITAAVIKHNLGSSTVSETSSVPAISVTASELEDAYAENTVSADARFKGRQLLVTGIVVSIDTDISDSAYLALQGTNPFLHTQAHLQESVRWKAGTLKPGAQVRLICTGNGDIVKTPMLKDCVFS